MSDTIVKGIVYWREDHLWIIPEDVFRPCLFEHYRNMFHELPKTSAEVVKVRIPEGQGSAYTIVECCHILKATDPYGMLLQNPFALAGLMHKGPATPEDRAVWSKDWCGWELKNLIGWLSRPTINKRQPEVSTYGHEIRIFFQYPDLCGFTLILKRDGTWRCEALQYSRTEYELFQK